jgi:hypothetical protein
MKKYMALLVFGMMVAMLNGCATTDSQYETRLSPPDEINSVFMGYKELPGQKVMVVAVDPDNNWAFGFDHSRETIEEAAESAAVYCDEARKKHNVFTKAKIFAINDDVVYYKNQVK